MPSKLVKPGCGWRGEVALKLPHRSSVLRDAISGCSAFKPATISPRSSDRFSTAAAARGNKDVHSISDVRKRAEIN